MVMPSRMPKTAATPKPTMNSLRLTRTCRSSSPEAASWRNFSQISEIGARMSGQRPVRPAISQSAATTASDSRPRKVEAWPRTQRADADSRSWRSSSSSRGIAALATGQVLTGGKSGAKHPGDEACIDVLHRVGRHVVAAGLAHVLGELLQHLFLHAQVLRNRFAIDVQFVDGL